MRKLSFSASPSLLQLFCHSVVLEWRRKAERVSYYFVEDETEAAAGGWLSTAEAGEEDGEIYDWKWNLVLLLLLLSPSYDFCRPPTSLYTRTNQNLY